MRHTIFAIILIIAGTALAQAPIGPEFLQRDRLRLEGDSLRFCVIQDNLLADYHRDLATELAATQLLEAEIFEVTPVVPSQPLDYRLSLSEQQLYYLLANDCQVFMGMALSPGLSRWEWLLTSRPYHLSRNVFVTLDPSLERWNDLPTEQAIGTRIQTSADIQFAMYLNGLPENQRWKRIPYYNNLVALEQLQEGQVDIALVWEPAVVHYLAEYPGLELRYLPVAPLSVNPLQLGLGYRSQDAFIQVMLDTAISELEQLGILRELAEKHGLPGLPLTE